MVLGVRASVARDGGGGGSGMKVAGRMCIDAPRRDRVAEERIDIGDVIKRTDIAIIVMAADSIRRNDDRSGIFADTFVLIQQIPCSLRVLDLSLSAVSSD